ncbi:NAD(P)H-hydrate epimerase [Candidatus Woesearchaeota archaeon]|nr:NAD(P)H-hydrate epimerase [Candidatus Woesearchaeota archaeon]
MITVSEMKRLEDSSGVSKLQLMENAGKRTADVLKVNFDLRGKRILVVCHHGNNGGDGFVIGRHLESDVLFTGEEQKLKEEARINYEKIRNKIIYDYRNINFNSYDFIIDAILGIGIEGKLREPISTVIDLINKSPAFKVAVDIPSGLNPDTEEVVDADLIITFHDIKKGLRKHKDKTVIVDIGIPKRASR